MFKFAPCSLNLQPTPNWKHSHHTKILQKSQCYGRAYHTAYAYIRTLGRWPCAAGASAGGDTAWRSGDALIECSHRLCCALFCAPGLRPCCIGSCALGQSAAARARAARGTAGHGATTSCLAWPRLMFLAGLRAPPQFELGQLLRRRLFRHDWSSRSTPTIRQIAVTWRRQCHDNRREVGTGVVKTARL